MIEGDEDHDYLNMTILIQEDNWSINEWWSYISDELAKDLKIDGDEYLDYVNMTLIYVTDVLMRYLT